MEAATTLDRPKYYSVKRVPNGVTDKRGARVICEKCGERDAIWTGTRRPTARIMAKRFDMCDECWKTRRME